MGVLREVQAGETRRVLPRGDLVGGRGRSLPRREMPETVPDVAERELAGRLAPPGESLRRRADRLLDHRRGVRAVELVERGQLIRAQPITPRLQEEQLEGLAQDRRRRRERVLVRELVGGLLELRLELCFDRIC